jgi:SLOG cluster2
MTQVRPLENRTVALSVSETPDLASLGMFEDDDKRVLSAVLTPLVYGGARIAYGGRIAPQAATNFTQEISTRLAEAYRQIGSSVASRPYVHYLRDNDARREGVDRFFAHCVQLGAYSEVKLLRGKTTVLTLLPSGRVVDVYDGEHRIGAARSAAELIKVRQIVGIVAGSFQGDPLATMRAAMAEETDARVILGGRVAGGSGGISGIAGEALATLAASKPLVVIGGIGGASRDVAWALDLLDDSERLEREDSAYVDSEKKPSKDQYWAQLESLREFGPSYRAMLESSNVIGLARRLAVSDSYSEIGSLVTTMLIALLPSR